MGSCRSGVSKPVSEPAIDRFQQPEGLGCELETSAFHGCDGCLGEPLTKFSEETGLFDTRFPHVPDELSTPAGS